MLRKLVVGLIMVSLLLGLSGITFAEKIEITWLVDSAFMPPTVQGPLKEAFEAEHPDYTLTFITKPSAKIRETVWTWAAAGTLPNVFYIPWGYELDEYTDAGVIIPIDDLVKEAGIDLSLYPEWGLERMTRKGKLYGLVTNVNLKGFINYNKKLFDEAGVAYPTADMSWEDLAETARKLTVTDEKGKVTRYGVFCKWPKSYLTVAFGGRIVEDVAQPKRILFGEPPYLEAMQWYRDLVDEGVMLDRETYADWGGSKPKIFVEEKVAMILTDLGYSGGFKEVNYDVEVLPHTKENFAHAYSSHRLGIGSQCKHPEAALELIRWFGLSETAMRIYQTVKLGDNSKPPFSPELQDAFEEIAKGRKPDNWRCFYDAMPYGIDPIPRGWEGAAEILAPYFDAQNKVLLGQEPVEYFIEVAAKCQKMLDELNASR